jgi:hypothetical protein
MSLCDRCKNKCKIDVIEIESCINFVGEAPHKIVTNFDRITASPEALAEFIYCLIEACDYAAGNGAKKISQYANEDANDKRNIELIHGNRDFGELLDWINDEECKE